MQTKGKKLELVEHLSQKRVANIPNDYCPNYDGDLNTVGNTVTELQTYPVAQLRYILNYHRIQTYSSKEEEELINIIIGKKYSTSTEKVNIISSPVCNNNYRNVQQNLMFHNV